MLDTAQHTATTGDSRIRWWTFAIVSMAICLWSGVSGVGLAVGPLVGGAVVNGLPWSTIFWLNIPIGILVLLLAVVRLEDSRGDHQPLDLPGLGLAAAGLVGIT